VNLVWVQGWVSHLEHAWTYPPSARILRRLGSFARLIRLDKRGTGLSDRVALTELPTLEQRMDDLRAVMDAVGSERAALMGSSEAGPMCVLFAATYPERTTALVLYDTYAKATSAPDYPWGFPADPEEREQFFQRAVQGWGTPVDPLGFAPTLDGDPAYLEWWATGRRLSASPGAALALARMNAEIDIRHVLSAIRVPTLVVQRYRRLHGARRCDR
jgi:pimeloyl-ACP methyl ester carboxylesterase